MREERPKETCGTDAWELSSPVVPIDYVLRPSGHERANEWFNYWQRSTLRHHEHMLLFHSLPEKQGWGDAEWSLLRSSFIQSGKLDWSWYSDLQFCNNTKSQSTRLPEWKLVGIKHLREMPSILSSLSWWNYIWICLLIISNFASSNLLSLNILYKREVRTLNAKH